MCQLIECEHERDTQDDGEGFDLRGGTCHFLDGKAVGGAGWLSKNRSLVPDLQS